MANYIAIDGGTTNTRVHLLKSGVVIDTVKIDMGVRINANGTDTYKAELKEAICKILSDNILSEKDIERVICSGMITSDLGLMTLPHLTLPCGIEEMAKATENASFPEITSIPFVFIRGLKTDSTGFENADMMRGEEAELMGLCEKLEESCLYVLPGSHSKLIETDKDGKIVSFSTEMTGELIEAISSHTILKGSIDLKNSSLDTSFLEKGFLYAKENGVNAAFFKVRTLKVLFGATDSEAYSFFMGIALLGEISNIIKSSAKKVVLGGKEVLKKPMAHLLGKFSDKEIICIPDEISNLASAYGAVKIYEHSIKKEL